MSNELYIFTPLNGNVIDTFRDHKCKAIWLNIERPGNYDEELWKQWDEIWLCDKEWSEATGSRFFLMGSDTRLANPSTRDQKAISLAYINGRRYKYNECDVDTRQHIEDRSEAVSRAKAMVVFHHDVPVISPQRFALCAAAKLPLIYERVADFYPFVDGEDFIAIDYDSNVNEILNRDLSAIGENLYNKLCIETNFRIEVEKMLNINHQDFL
jgi:hypothetical protein